MYYRYTTARIGTEYQGLRPRDTLLGMTWVEGPHGYSRQEPTRENTHVIEVDGEYTKKSLRFSRLLQQACAEAEAQGKNIVQVIFKNGIRVYRFNKALQQEETDPVRYVLQIPPHFQDDFREEDLELEK